MPPYSSVPQNSTLSTARFGPFEIDLRTCELRKLGIKLKLSGQPFPNPGHPCRTPWRAGHSREELRESLWPATPLSILNTV